ncbi:MAG: sigma-54 interaction domain-containing protein [Steroidobacteraceae bacterium]
MVTEQRDFDGLSSNVNKSDAHGSVGDASTRVDDPSQFDAALSQRVEPAWLRNGGDLVACAAESQRLVILARRVAASDCTVLISGESGTGKEVMARYIHSSSARAQQPFIAVNCAAIPDTMLEAMLFGHERGSFTGAHAANPGKFELAQHGTILLDEVSEMPLALQSKLLRILQEREVERLGGRHSIALDVRVLATTNRSLRAEVTAGRFREDLYYRLNVFPLHISPLRLRRDDVLPLAMRLLNQRSRPGSRIPALSADAAHRLLTYSWPGNVRELDNVMQRALVFVTDQLIDAEHIQFEQDIPPLLATGQVGSSAPALSDSLEFTERGLIIDALQAGNGNRRAAAERLGISQRTLRYKLARLRDAGVAVPAA